jgi:hypothetical protein
MTDDAGNRIREMIRAEAVKGWAPDNLASQAGQPWNEAVHGPAAAAYASHYDKEARWLGERGKNLSAMAAKYGMPVSGPPAPSARTPAQQAKWEATERERIRLSGKR